ncbi:MAG: cation-transporting P-type ATPase [Candidatus Micrarchaeota archaeon]|nr:cation-transporting P-type ATPase [Candidatus Micrarchaeota archaeon]
MEIEYPESKLSVDEVLKKYNSSYEGLSDKQIEINKSFGSNKIEAQKKESILHLFIRQFQNLAIYILIFASVVSALLGHYKDAIAIGFAVLLSGVIGFIQEYRSEQALLYLKKLSISQIRTIRNGKELLVNSDELVVGDIVVLNEGTKIPADIRIIEGKEIFVNESTLTGESFPVEKSSSTNSNNILYSGTILQKGDCKGIVIAVGKNTIFGKIAKIVSEEEHEKTPLQKNLDELGQKIAYLIITLIIVFFLYGYFIAKKDFFDILTMAIILGVAGISEGLPTVIAITLALGMQEIAKRKAIVKRMSAIEDLGCITCICTDKTGTLTMNLMEPKNVFANQMLYDITAFRDMIKKLNEQEKKNNYGLFFYAVAIANNSSINEEGQELGDPTETGLLKIFKQIGINHNKLRNEFHVLHENKFDSERKMMSVVVEHKETKHRFLFSKGASEKIIELCTHYLHDNKFYQMTKKQKNFILEEIQKIESKGARILSFAYKKFESSSIIEKELKNEENLVYLGFIALYDPPRKEARYAVEMAYKAGIKIYMITGDSKGTAENIAKEVGFKKTSSMSGKEFSELKKADRNKVLNDVYIFYRVNPIEKYDIVTTLKEQGEIVAVTGDGINDAPAIKKSDIGIVMGKTGADVTKEVGSIILLDENFKTIVVAIELGRKIFDNILNFIRFQFTTTTNLLSTMFIAGIMRLPDPLTPIQILFINIIMDGPPALSLGLEEATEDIMNKKPRDPKKPYISNEMIIAIFSSAAFMTGVSLVTLYTVNYLNIMDTQEYVTFGFVLMVCLQLFNALNCRSYEDSAFKNLNKNKYLLASILVSFIVLLLFIYVEFLNEFLNTTPLKIEYLVSAIIIASSVLIVEELRKYIYRIRTKNKNQK